MHVSSSICTFTVCVVRVHIVILWKWQIICFSSLQNDNLNCVPISRDTRNNSICNFSTEIICELQHPGLVVGVGVKNVKALGEDYVHCVPIIVYRLPSHAECCRLQKQYGTCEGRLQRDYSPGGDDSVRELRLNRCASSLPLTKRLHGNTTKAAIAWPRSTKLNLCFAYQKENLNYHKKGQKNPSGLSSWLALVFLELPVLQI